MVTKEELNEIFERIGNDFGYRDVTAEYAPFMDMKIKWSRTSDWARFTVSDYLEEAPSEVVDPSDIYPELTRPGDGLTRR